MIKEREFLRAAREAKELNSAEAGRLCDISPSYYRYIELGTRKPSGDVALRMSKVFNIPMEKFFE